MLCSELRPSRTSLVECTLQVHAARRRGFFNFTGWVGAGGAVLFCADIEEAIVSTVLEEVSKNVHEGLGGTDEDGGVETECRSGAGVG